MEFYKSTRNLNSWGHIGKQLFIHSAPVILIFLATYYFKEDANWNRLRQTMKYIFFEKW